MTPIELLNNTVKRIRNLAIPFRKSFISFRAGIYVCPAVPFIDYVMDINMAVSTHAALIRNPWLMTNNTVNEGILHKDQQINNAVKTTTGSCFQPAHGSIHLGHALTVNISPHVVCGLS